MFSAQEAVELFIEAYAHLESAVLPGTRLIQVGGLPCLQFAGLRKQINHEIFTHGLAPAEIAARIQGSAPGLPHWLTLLTASPQDDLPILERSGYRLRDSEMMMARELDPASLPLPDARVSRAHDPAQLRVMNAMRGSRIYHPGQLADPLLHIRCLEIDGRIRSWGNALFVRSDTVYIANMYTPEKYRRQGLARAVLSSLLASAAGQGARRSLLVSSRAGTGLYHAMGYQDLLSCLVFTSEGQA